MSIRSASHPLCIVYLCEIPRREEDSRSVEMLAAEYALEVDEQRDALHKSIAEEIARRGRDA